jgi:hypothetical protein
VRDSFSDGFFTRMAHETHPVDLMCLYLLHGSAGQIPDLLADREALSFGRLCERGRDAGHWTSGDADMSSLCIQRKVGGRLYGLVFRIDFTGGEPWSDAVIPFGAAVDLVRFLHHFRGHYVTGGAPGNWDFDVYTTVHDPRESIVLFGNRREVFFGVDRGPGQGPVIPGEPKNRHRLVTRRLKGKQFGAGAAMRNAGGPLFPDRLAAVGGTSAEARAYRRYVARLRDPLPLPEGRPARPEFGKRARRRPAG